MSRRSSAADRGPAPLDPAAFRAALLAWYDANGRELPFRGVDDPWAILVSEAMAQQTQASRAGEAWRVFMRAYPTPSALADASPADVLRAWRGLGYNRRALALRAAAVSIVTEHDGRVPEDLADLRRLPGVGPYTARAVAALAFGRPVGAVDTNVRRVLGRVAGPARTATPAALQRLADELVDPIRPGDWTHAVMDVGARLCRPVRPACRSCPLARWCLEARTLGTAAASPPVGSPPVGARPVGSPPVVRAVGERPADFSSTGRWLRGRVVDRLRDAPDGEWVRLDARIGGHGPEAVAAALAGLERDGLVERHGDDALLVRLPHRPSAERAPR